MEPEGVGPLEGSVQTVQVLLDEQQAMRTRIAELEQMVAVHHQRFMREKEAKDALESELYHLQKITESQASELSNREAALQEVTRGAEEQIYEFETIFETLTDALAVYDQAGQIVRMNQAFQELLGTQEQPAYSSQPLSKRGASIAIRDDHEMPLPAEQWPARRILNGETLTSKSMTDIMVSALDGRKIQINVSGAPIRNEQGGIVGAVAIYRDVTEQRKLERRTQNSLNALLTMAEVLVQGTDLFPAGQQRDQSSLNGIIQRLARLARRVLDCKRVGVLLVEPESGLLQPVMMIGATAKERKHWLSFYEGTYLRDYRGNAQGVDILHADKPITLEALGNAVSGELCSCLHFPMRGGTQLIGLLSLDYGEGLHKFSREEEALAAAVSRLIALVLERERLLQERAEAHANELALLEANRRTDEFLGIASHELRTPLTTINGNIQLAKRRLKMFVQEDTQENFLEKLDLVQELLGRAERQVRVQNRLVGDLLDASRIQSNRLELHMEHLDLAAIISESVEDQRAATPSRTISLDIASEEPVPIFADHDRIFQVVTNYLTNALKYSPADTPVAVCLSVMEGMARLSVRDQGPGLPAEEQERLWQRFYRVPGIVVQSGSGVGLGLGLYICRTIIEHHNGHVGVESIPGDGATFWFTLPLA